MSLLVLYEAALFGAYCTVRAGVGTQAGMRYWSEFFLDVKAVVFVMIIERRVFDLNRLRLSGYYWKTLLTSLRLLCNYFAFTLDPYARGFKNCDNFLLSLATFKQLPFAHSIDHF